MRIVRRGGSLLIGLLRLRRLPRAAQGEEEEGRAEEDAHEPARVTPGGDGRRACANG